MTETGFHLKLYVIKQNHEVSKIFVRCGVVFLKNVLVEDTGQYDPVLVLFALRYGIKLSGIPFSTIYSQSARKQIVE